MMRYFIDTSDGDVTVRDEVGQEFDGDLAAREAALIALPEMARDKIPDGAERTFEASLRDADGRVIYTASLHLKGAWHKR